MIPEQNIAKFLETFNKNDKVQLRIFEILKNSVDDPSSLFEMVDFIKLSGINENNLDFIIEKYKEKTIEKDEKSQETSLPEENDKFVTYLKDPNAFKDEDIQTHGLIQEKKDIQTHGLIEKKEDIQTHELIEEKEDLNDIKRIKLDESSSLEAKSGELPGIPGLGDVSTEEGENGIINNKFNQIKHIRSSTAINIKQSTNKEILSDTVFYQKILPEIKIKSLIDLSVDACPDYLFPVLQCKLCGLRFGSQYSQEFGLHIDDHRRFTNALGEKVILRREFFSSKTVNKIEKLDLIFEGDAEATVWELESPNCSICGKLIKKIWDDKIENWVLEEGTKINENEVAHKKCVY